MRNFEDADVVTIHDPEWSSFILKRRVGSTANGVVYWPDGAWVSYIIGDDEIAYPTGMHLRGKFTPETAHPELEDLLRAFRDYIVDQDLTNGGWKL